MSPCTCGGGGHVEGKTVRCRKCLKVVGGDDKWDAIYNWNCENPGKHADERRREEFFAQEPEEFNRMLELITQGPILEIGSRYGQALKRMAERLPAGSRVVAVDLGQDPYSPLIDTERYLLEVIQGLHGKGYDAHFVKGDSHDPQTIEKVRQLGPYAFTFVDGEHTAEGVRRDWEAYGPMSEVIAFHDIKNNLDMERFWEANRGPKHREIVHSNMGIGVRWRT